MSTPEQLIKRIRSHRKYQPSAIGNSLFMLLVRYTSLLGFFALSATSIYIYASGNAASKHDKYFDAPVHLVKEVMHLRMENSVDQAYLIMMIALMCLVVYKLTTMVLRRNDYIFTLNEIMDEE